MRYPNECPQCTQPLQQTPTGRTACKSCGYLQSDEKKCTFMEGWKQYAKSHMFRIRMRRANNQPIQVRRTLTGKIHRVKRLTEINIRQPMAQALRTVKETTAVVYDVRLRSGLNSRPRYPRYDSRWTHCVMSFMQFAQIIKRQEATPNRRGTIEARFLRGIYTTHSPLKASVFRRSIPVVGGNLL
jgi:uncharacterized Zn finger protein (UPF0148 family)